jgi:signal transduction histidine kinase
MNIKTLLIIIIVISIVITSGGGYFFLIRSGTMQHEMSDMNYVSLLVDNEEHIVAMTIFILIELLFFFIIFFLFQNRVANRIDTLNKGMKIITDGNLSFRIMDKGEDEIGQLFVSFNKMITKLQEIDQVKSEFIILASHQLKTPATGIRWLTERALAGKIGTLDPEQKKYFIDISNINLQMIDLVNSLLNVSRIDLGTFTIKPELKDICVIIKNLLHELRIPILEKKLTLRGECLNENKLLLIDEVLLRMVINNIVGNAIRYTPEGGSIEIEFLEAKKNQEFDGQVLLDDYFILKVKDNGYGIPEKQQSKIFTKFFRANNVKEKYPDGTGLGLYMTKSIIDYSGCLIWFSSKENKGTTFYVAIPKTGMKARLGNSTSLIYSTNQTKNSDPAFYS